MNLIFRLAWTLLGAWLGLRWGKPVGFFDEVKYSFRCLPTDIDFNMHLTNSRYASFMDIARVAMMVRNGAWGKFRAAGMLPVLGSLAMKFRRAVKPFQEFEVTARTIGWDEKWMYLEHKLLINGDVAAIAVMKAAFLGPKGRVNTADFMAVVGYSGPKPDHMPVIERLVALDDALRG